MPRPSPASDRPDRARRSRLPEASLRNLKWRPGESRDPPSSLSSSGKVGPGYRRDADIDALDAYGSDPRLTVPDLLRHREIDEIGVGKRPLEADPAHFEQHHPLPAMLADMPGRALQHLMQFLRPVLGLHGLLAGFVGRRCPPLR